jgi:hypothetical protein
MLIEAPQYNIPSLDYANVPYTVFDETLNTPQVSACVWFALSAALDMELKTLGELVTSTMTQKEAYNIGPRTKKYTRSRIQQKLNNLGGSAFPVYSVNLYPHVLEARPDIAIVVFNTARSDRNNNKEPWRDYNLPEGLPVAQCYYNLKRKTAPSRVVFFLRSIDNNGGHVQAVRVGAWRTPEHISVPAHAKNLAASPAVTHGLSQTFENVQSLVVNVLAYVSRSCMSWTKMPYFRQPPSRSLGSGT